MVISVGLVRTDETPKFQFGVFVKPSRRDPATLVSTHVYRADAQEAARLLREPTKRTNANRWLFQ